MPRMWLRSDGKIQCLSDETVCKIKSGQCGRYDKCVVVESPVELEKQIEQLKKELDGYKQDGEIYSKVVNHYGAELQKEKAVEECNELIQAIKYGNRENIKEEIADVINMAVQLAIIYDIPREEIRKIAAQKMNRTLERIKEADE